MLPIKDETTSTVSTILSSVPNTEKCDPTALAVCIEHKGGNACYAKNHCPPGTPYTIVAGPGGPCNREALLKCLEFKGGRGCYKKHACEIGEIHDPVACRLTLPLCFDREAARPNPLERKDCFAQTRCPAGNNDGPVLPNNLAEVWEGGFSLTPPAIDDQLTEQLSQSDGSSFLQLSETTELKVRAGARVYAWRHLNPHNQEANQGDFKLKATALDKALMPAVLALLARDGSSRPLDQAHEHLRLYLYLKKAEPNMAAVYLLSAVRHTPATLSALLGAPADLAAVNGIFSSQVTEEHANRMIQAFRSGYLLREEYADAQYEKLQDQSGSFLESQEATRPQETSTQHNGESWISNWLYTDGAQVGSFHDVDGVTTYIAKEWSVVQSQATQDIRLSSQKWETGVPIWHEEGKFFFTWDGTNRPTMLPAKVKPTLEGGKWSQGRPVPQNFKELRNEAYHTVMKMEKLKPPKPVVKTAIGAFAILGLVSDVEYTAQTYGLSYAEATYVVTAAQGSTFASMSALGTIEAGAGAGAATVGVGGTATLGTGFAVVAGGVLLVDSVVSVGVLASGLAAWATKDIPVIGGIAKAASEGTVWAGQRVSLSHQIYTFQKARIMSAVLKQKTRDCEIKKQSGDPAFATTWCAAGEVKALTQLAYMTNPDGSVNGDSTLMVSHFAVAELEALVNDKAASLPPKLDAPKPIAPRNPQQQAAWRESWGKVLENEHRRAKLTSETRPPSEELKLVAEWISAPRNSKDQPALPSTFADKKPTLPAPTTPCPSGRGIQCTMTGITCNCLYTRNNKAFTLCNGYVDKDAKCVSDLTPENTGGVTRTGLTEAQRNLQVQANIAVSNAPHGKPKPNPKPVVAAPKPVVAASKPHPTPKPVVAAGTGVSTGGALDVNQNHLVA